MKKFHILFFTVDRTHSRIQISNPASIILRRRHLPPPLERFTPSIPTSCIHPDSQHRLLGAPPDDEHATWNFWWGRRLEAVTSCSGGSLRSRVGSMRSCSLLPDQAIFRPWICSWGPGSSGDGRNKVAGGWGREGCFWKDVILGVEEGGSEVRGRRGLCQGKREEVLWMVPLSCCCCLIRPIINFLHELSGIYDLWGVVVS